MSGLHASLDAPGTVCYFDSNNCSASMLGHGGFDQHHAIPVELGGDPNQPLLPLCPNHHRRQHSLIRYLVECLVGNVPPARAVTGHFTTAERNLASTAVNAWDAAGRPAINGWPCPAAR